MTRRIALAVALTLTTITTFGIVALAAQTGMFGAPPSKTTSVLARHAVPPPPSATSAPPAPTPTPIVITDYIYIDDPTAVPPTAAPAHAVPVMAAPTVAPISPAPQIAVNAPRLDDAPSAAPTASGQPASEPEHERGDD
ncbi:MAG TPA: hypothetical protein VEZ14_08495 [Dehalococcoidia bacterium]|nr:hypothetical protein [Dehalococcoidia bacterium]